MLAAASTELLSRIASLPPERLLPLLEASFPFVGIADLRAVPLAVLDALAAVPASFLKQLASDRELFWELPPGVQRQVRCSGLGACLGLRGWCGVGTGGRGGEDGRAES